MALSRAEKEYIDKAIEEKFQAAAARLEADSKDKLVRIAHAVRNHVQGPLHKR